VVECHNQLLLGEIIMPDIPAEEKEKIRSLAKIYSNLLSNISFKNGSYIYYSTFKSIYKRSARWKYCMICGKIDTPETFQNEHHLCPSVVFHKVQVLVSTSWIQLKKFFLNGEYKTVLKEIGIENYRDFLKQYSIRE
jgi:hypothetical protein